MPVNMAPRMNVSSMNATASPLTRRATTSFATAATPKSTPLRHSNSPSAAMIPTTANMVADPSTSPSAISRTNWRRGNP